MRTRNQRGGALLTVLWLSAALTAIAFSVSTTVRGETERTATTVDQTRAYYLATGAVDRAILWMQWGRNMSPNADGTARFWTYTLTRLPMRFPTGYAEVEIIPETSKLNINTANPPELQRLFLSMGLNPALVEQLTAAILDWRQAAPGPTAFDQYYAAQVPSFRARHASFEQIEELLLVRGVTPDLFYGTWVRNPAGQLVRTPGLKDCLTLYGSNSQFDINMTSPPVLLSLGIPPDVVAQIVARRTVRPFLRQEELGPIVQAAGPGAGRLRLGGGSIFTLRATATLPGNEVRRSVATVIKFNWDDKDEMTPYHILRWYDNAGTN
ncbi:MAG: general secretion pathway protein GspK [Acidobacteriaceae bacterium]|nr:general secretion pathway protein GspK [Acidobacteriaceae bacterium]